MLYTERVLRPASPAEILVVDDDAGVRELAVMVLEGNGYGVRSAESADLALADLQRNATRTAAVVTDVQMPGEIDGADLARIVAERWPDMAVLVTSGSTQAVGALPRGVQFLPKPWRVDEMIAVLNRGLADSGQPPLH